MKIVLLDKSHNRKNFLCEEESLSEYIQKQVSQDIRKRLATCFVIADEQKNVIGYYTLTSESLGRQEIPEEYGKKVPESYNVPVILIGRLARDLTQKGNGLGDHLLLDALFRSYRLSSDSLGAIAVIVYPLNKNAIDFYSKYGFVELPDSKKMFLPMKVISKLI